MKILLVEDNDDSRQYLKFLLELSDYQVIEAVNGQEAVETIKHETVDLILMDISMPVMDGMTATRKIRELIDIDKLPIIAVTALGNSYRREVIQAGCNDLIAKPVDMDMLTTMLEIYLIL